MFYTFFGAIALILLFIILILLLIWPSQTARFVLFFGGVIAGLLSVYLFLDIMLNHGEWWAWALFLGLGSVVSIRIGQRIKHRNDQYA